MTAIVLAELTVYDPDAAAEAVVRVATGSYGHASAPGFYRDAILERSRFRREIFRDGQAFGAGSQDYGLLRLANLDGWLDWLAGCYADGRSLRLLIGDDQAGYGTFEVIFTGVVAALEVDVAEVRVNIHDAFTTLLEQPIGLDTFAGTNNPHGVEGDAAIKGQHAPVLYGYAFNFAPILVDAYNMIWCVCDRAVDALTVSAVSDRGAAITAGVEHASVAALQAAAPAANTYDYYLGSATERAYIKLGSSPVGAVTVTAYTGVAAAERTAAQLWRRILAERCGAVAISAADVTALDAAAPAELGHFAQGAESRRAVLDLIAGSVGAGYWQDRTGTWRIGRIAAPGGSPVATFAALSLDRPGRAGDADILSIRPLFTGRADGGVPPSAITLRYARNHTVQDKDALAGVALDAAQRLSAEWLSARAENGAAALHPLATEWQADTAFRHQAEAEAEASRRVSLFGPSRRRFDLRVVLTPAVAAVLDLGVEVRIEHSRLGLTAGRDVIVTGLTVDLLALTADITVWG